MRSEGAPHTAPSRGIACVLAAAPPVQTGGGIASSEERGFPQHRWPSAAAATAAAPVICLAARLQWPASRAICLAARVTTAGGAGDLHCGAGSLPCGAATTAGVPGDLPCGAGKGGNGRRRGQFALRLRTEAKRVYTQVPAWLTPQRWRWTAATPTARRMWLTPLRVTDPKSIGPPTRRCESASASRLVLRARWPDRGGRWGPGQF